MLRRAADSLYKTAEFLAATCVFAIFAIILLQVLLSLVDRLLTVVGFSPMGMSIPSYAEIAAYLLVAATFLGLSSTLVNEVHVRVTLLLSRAPPTVSKAMNLACGIIGLVVSSFFFWRSALLVHESWSYGDTSYGQIAIPLWIPQSTMSLGLIFLIVAFADFAWCSVRHTEKE